MCAICIENRKQKCFRHEVKNREKMSKSEEMLRNVKKYVDLCNFCVSLWVNDCVEILPAPLHYPVSRLFPEIDYIKHKKSKQEIKMVI